MSMYSSVEESLTPVVALKYSTISNNYNQLLLKFKGNYSTEFRTFNEKLLRRHWSFWHGRSAVLSCKRGRPTLGIRIRRFLTYGSTLIHDCLRLSSCTDEERANQLTILPAALYPQSMAVFFSKNAQSLLRQKHCLYHNCVFLCDDSLIFNLASNTIFLLSSLFVRILSSM